MSDTHNPAIEQTRTLSTPELAQKFFTLLQSSAYSHEPIDEQKLADYMLQYPQSMASSGLTDDNCTSIGTYLAYRLPKEMITHVGPVQIHLVSNLPDGPFKRSKGRARNYIANESDGTMQIFYHIRDTDPDKLTDLNEMLSWVGSWAMLKRLQKDNPAWQKLSSLLQKNLRLEDIEKNHVYLHNDVGDPMKLTYESTRAHTQLADEIAHFLQGKEKPTMVLFGNDFTFRNLLLIGLLSDDDVNVLKKHFQQNLMAVMDTCQDDSDDMRECISRYALISFLDMYADTLPPEVEQIKIRIKSNQAFSSIGSTRIIQTDASPIGDPVDYYNPNQISQDTVENYPEPLRGIIQHLMKDQSTILSVPYTLGHLTTNVLTALSKKLGYTPVIGFIGKVGSYKSGAAESLPIGTQVRPTKALDQYNHPVLEVPKKGKGRETDIYCLSTSGLTMQTMKEMEALIQELGDDTKLILDMELFPLLSFGNMLAKAGVPPQYILSYYVSDTTFGPRAQAESERQEDKISNSLKDRGVAVVAKAVFDILQQLEGVR